MFATRRGALAPPLALALALAAASCGGPTTRTGAMAPPIAGAGVRIPAATPGSGDDADGEGKADWDVNAARGETRQVAIDVDEGTWISVDVSPDGKTLAFDLLGDIYLLPIAGGEARSFTSGLAWDMQPRFSPDGTWLAFTSDRGGGDNIWIARTDGTGEPRAITQESFRLLNSPSWSPDGQYIVARKHFTGTRSLGSGEMWLYHVGGGAGVALTEKPNDQQDVGEPALSPDGRYLYYSQDTTRGPTFRYNKNPHEGIYSIKRVELSEQRTDTLVAGPGGAVRPTPSPDGKTLAYVGRRGNDTVLWLYDLDSGKQTPVYDALDRDMQETWAIHGVYPAFAFTPDSQHIVFWAGGKIRKLELATRTVVDIPFRVQDTRTVSAAVRFPVEVHPDRFDVKMLRWATVSPDGSRVVYQALGHLYVKELPNGEPRRLTTDSGVAENYPSFSRDGQGVVYVAWSDDKLAEVRVVAAAGGAGRAITTRPGHYAEPVFSPDGSTIVFRKGSGGWLRSPLYSSDPGLYRVPTAGGESTLIARRGRQPHFGAEDDRLYFIEQSYNTTKVETFLRSIAMRPERDGDGVLTHATFSRATGARVSPDGRWIAFREGFKVYVAPFPPASRPYTLGPGAKNLPVAAVSSRAGSYLHWSGDARRLHWSHGPELFTRELSDTFAFVEGAPETLPEEDPAGVAINFSVESDVPKGTAAFVGARIVTMKGDEVIDDGVVVVENNRIVAVGKRGEVTVPAGATTFDVAGKTILPGLVDVHAHGAQATDGFVPQQNWLHLATLAFGVTTIHDPSNDTAAIFSAAELARRGDIVAPRIFSTGRILYGAESTAKAVIDSLDDARFHLARMKAVGAISVKSYNQPRRDQRQQVLEAARELGVMVVPEGGSLFMHNMTMVVDGHTGIEHSIPVAEAYADVVALWGGTDVQYTPTIGVGYGGLNGEIYWYQESDVFAHPLLRAYVPPFAYEPKARRRTMASDGDWNHIAIARVCKKLLDAGVRVNMGAHGQREGLAAHWELWSFVQGGMTPLEAIRASTLDAARYVGLDRDIGSLEVGKLADLFVVRGNPLEDVRVTDDVEWVMINGRLFEASTMNQKFPGEVRRAKLFFEE